MEVFETEAGVLGSDGTPLVVFGDTPLGTPVFKQILIHNVGIANLVLGPTPPILPPGFRYEGSFPVSSTVPPGSYVAFTVALSADFKGQYLGSFSIVSNDVRYDASPFFEVSMRGAVFGLSVPEIAGFEQTTGM